MKRQIIQELKAWKSKRDRKPLLLMGARQVGKTYALKTFGKDCYQNVIYINFETMPKMATLFTEDLDPERILMALSIEMNVDIHPQQSLIILDEIQESPEALNSLKYFCEQKTEYHIVAAGSLLGVKLAHIKGFPVGKVDFLHLYPLSFLEFLEALDKIKLKNYIEELGELSQLSSTLHESLLNYFKQYLTTGGMPEVVAHFAQTNQLNEVRELQSHILQAYQLDFAQHAPPNQVMRINQVWQSLPSQLGKENKKFIYSIIRKGARAKEFEGALQWLMEAGLIYKIAEVSTPKIPLKAYANFEYFKTYMLDVGLLGATANLPISALLHGNELFQEFKGSLVENYIAQELARKQYGLFYWTSGNKAEIDFLIQHEADIYPLEIKSGSSSKKKSLLVYKEKYQPKFMIRVSPMNLKKDGHILNCPIYLFSELERFLQY